MTVAELIEELNMIEDKTIYVFDLNGDPIKIEYTEHGKYIYIVNENE